MASQKSALALEEYALQRKGEIRASGRAVGGKIASGRAHVITDIDQLNQFQPGEILVTDTTMPDWGTVMKIAAAIVTNRGGRTCHAAIVARELGIPAIVGCDTATEAIHSGEEITVSCAEGDIGHAYAGSIPFRKTSTDLSTLADAENAFDGQHRQSRYRVPDPLSSQRRRRPGAHGIHRGGTYQDPSDGADPSGTDRRPQGPRGHRKAYPLVCRRRPIISSGNWPRASA